LKGQAPEVNAFGMLTASTLIMIPLAIAIEGIPSFALSAPVWGSLLGLAWLATALAYMLYL